MQLPPISHAAVDWCLDAGVPAGVIRAAADYQCRDCGATAGICWDHAEESWVPCCRHRPGCRFGRGNLFVRPCACPGCTEGSAP